MLKVNTYSRVFKLETKLKKYNMIVLPFVWLTAHNTWNVCTVYMLVKHRVYFKSVVCAFERGRFDINPHTSLLTFIPKLPYRVFLQFEIILRDITAMNVSTVFFFFFLKVIKKLRAKSVEFTMGCTDYTPIEDCGIAQRLHTTRKCLLFNKRISYLHLRLHQAAVSEGIKDGIPQLVFIFLHVSIHKLFFIRL